jgi:hypothetical protein
MTEKFVNLEFVPEVRRSFDAIANEFGLSAVDENEWRVRYADSKTFMNVNYDNGRSHELGVEIGRVSSSERPFSLGEILRSVGNRSAIADGLLASDFASMRNVLVRLAELTREYAAEYLCGNDIAYARLARLREQEGVAYALDRDLRQANVEADEGWTKKDFVRVVRALEPFQQYLSDTMLRRLEYARRKLGT